MLPLLYHFGYKQKTAAFSVHTLLSHTATPYYLVGIYSFLRYIPTSPQIVIYDDGTILNQDIRMLRMIPNVRIIPKTQSDQLVVHIFGKKSVVPTYRAATPYNRKLIDIFLHKPSEGNMLILDSDVLFFRYPAALLTFLLSSGGITDMMFLGDIKDSYIAGRGDLSRIFNIRFVSRFNSGVLAVKPSSITKRGISRYYTAVDTKLKKRKFHIEWTEQTGFAFLASSVRAVRLPDSYAIPGRVSDSTVCMHYVHGHRKNYIKDIFRFVFLKGTR